MQHEWWKEKVARRISLGVGKAADFRAPAPKGRGVVCLREERQKCILAQGDTMCLLFDVRRSQLTESYKFGACIPGAIGTTDRGIAERVKT
jgi:hypothetical protein